MDLAEQLNGLANALNTKEEDVLKHALASLGEFLASNSDGFALLFSNSQAFTLIIQGLNHPSQMVRLFVLKKLATALDNPKLTSLAYDSLVEHKMHIQLLNMLSYSITDAEQSSLVVGKIAAQRKEGCVLCTPEFLDRVKEMMEEKHPELVLRLVDMLVRACQMNPHLYTLPEISGLLNIREFLNEKDPLTAMNAIRTIDKISETEAGRTFLFSNGYFAHMVELLSALTCKKDPFLYPNLAPCVASIVKQTAFQGDADTAKAIGIFESLMDAQGDFIQEPAIAAFGVMGSAALGLQALFTHANVEPPALPPALKKMTSFTRSAAPLLRDSAFHSLAIILEPSGDEKHEAMMEAVFAGFDKFAQEDAGISAPALMLKLARELYREDRDIILHLFRSLCDHQWATGPLLTTPGFHEWLTNRGTEITLDGKKWKFGMVEALERRKEVVKALPNGLAMWADLSNYCQEGVVYSAQETAAAVETEGM